MRQRDETNLFSGPEFQIYSTQTAADRTDIINTALYGTLDKNVTLSLTPFIDQAGDINSLMSYIASVFLHGAMSVNLQTAVASAANAQSTAIAKAQAALYTVLTSGEYQAIHQRGTHHDQTQRIYSCKRGHSGSLALRPFGLLPALAHSGSDYRALVCVFLFGGNDSNNTIVPMDASFKTYTSIRASLALNAISRAIAYTGSVSGGAKSGAAESVLALRSAIAVAKFNRSGQQPHRLGGTRG
jgi:hypothetical protein